MYIWPYSPNWGAPFRLTLAFETMVLSSREGEETRLARRLHPRLKMEYKTLRGDDDAQASRLAMKTRQYDDILCPVWALEGTAVANTTQYAGVFSMTLEDCKVLFGGDGMQGEGVQLYIAELGSPYTATVSNIYPSDGGLCIIEHDSGGAEVEDRPAPPPATPVYLAIHARFTDQITYTSRRDDLIQTSVSFDDLPGLSPARPTAAPIFPLLADAEVFDFPIDGAKPPTREMVDNRVVIDNKRGNPSLQKPIAYNSETTKVSVLLQNTQEINAFMDFFIRHRGRNKSFYFPSQEQDFTVQTANMNDSDIILSGRDFRGLFEDPSPARGFSLLEDEYEFFGAVRRQKYLHGLITAPQFIPDDRDISQLYLREALPAGFDLTKVVRGSILYTARFAEDLLTITYITPIRARVEVGIKTIPYEGPTGSG